MKIIVLWLKCFFNYRRIYKKCYIIRKRSRRHTINIDHELSVDVTKMTNELLIHVSHSWIKIITIFYKKSSFKNWFCSGCFICLFLKIKLILDLVMNKSTLSFKFYILKNINWYSYWYNYNIKHRVHCDLFNSIKVEYMVLNVENSYIYVQIYFALDASFVYIIS